MTLLQHFEILFVVNILSKGNISKYQGLDFVLLCVVFLGKTHFLSTSIENSTLW